MAHDVFISYSTENKNIANAICHILEEARIRCWIAPRDVSKTVTYSEAIINGINEARVFLLVYSSDADRSDFVFRELERAATKKKTIITFRIEDFIPSKRFEFFISATNWLDAVTTPVENSIRKLAEIIADIIKIPLPPPPPPPPTEKRWRFLKWLIPSAVLIIAAVFAFFFLLTPQIPAVKTAYGNTTGNINNRGFACESGGWIYLCDPVAGGGLYKMKGDGSGKSLLTQNNARSINVVGDWVYYSNDDDNGYIYKIKTDGSANVKIVSDDSHDVTVVSDWIYYMNLSNGWKLYKIKTDGSDKTILYDGYVNMIHVVGDWIYFVQIPDEYNTRDAGMCGYIYKIKTDGTALTKLSDELVEGSLANFAATENFIFFVKKDDKEGLFRMDTGGNGICKISYDYTPAIIVDGDWIYYSNARDSLNLYRMTTSGEEKKRLSEDKLALLNVLPDWILYTTMSVDNAGNPLKSALYMIKNDGTNKTELK